MGALTHNVVVIQNEDLIGVLDRGDTLGDDDDSRIFRGIL